MYTRKYFLIALILLGWFGSTAQNNCLEFDGTNNYVTCGAINLSGSEITLECWVNVDAFQSNDPYISQLVGTESAGNSSFLRLGDSDIPGGDKIQFVLYFTDQQIKLTSTSTLQTNEWYHIAGVYNSASGMKLYINGVEDASNGQSGNFNSNATFYMATNDGTGRYLDGSLEEVRVWNDARTEAEIRQNMYRELPNPSGEANLVSYYKLNESDGSTTATDSRGSNDGTLTNMSGNEWQTSSAIFGPKNAMDFDGTDDYVDCGNGSGLQITGTEITLEAWINADNFASNSHENPIIDKHGQSVEGYTLRCGGSGILSFNLGDGSSWHEVVSPANSLSNNTWHHVAGVYDGTNMKIYVDGEEVNSGSTGASISDNGSNMSIGGAAEYQDRRFDGKIEEVRVWSVARSPSQIIENMCNTLTGNESGLVAYYNFDNSSGELLQDFGHEDQALSDGTWNGNSGGSYTSPEWTSSTAFNTWLNASSTSWSTGSNWSLGSDPNSTSVNVGIPDHSTAYDPEITSGTQMNKLVVGEDATLTFNHNGSHTIHGSVFNIGTTNLEANTDLTITGSLYVLPWSTLNIKSQAFLTVDKNLDTDFFLGDGNLNIKSDASGTGSLIIGGSANGDITVERYLTADKWHYISGQTNISDNFSTLNMELTGGAGNDQFYYWDESFTDGEDIGFWIDILNGNGSGSLMGSMGFEDCKGYAITYKNSNKTLSLSGIPYVTNQNINLTKTASSTGEGSNLVGNPFCSTIAINDDADASNNFLDQNTAALDNSYEAIYIWNESEGWDGTTDADYDLYNNASESAFFASPGQAFMVQAASDGATLNFNTSIRKHGSSAFYKNVERNESARMKLYVISPDNYSNKTEFFFREDMSKDLDPSYDAGKLKGNPNLALYSRLIEDNGIDFGIQALPYFEEDYAVKIGLDIAESGEYTFEVDQIDLIPQDIYVYFEDKESGSIVNFKETSKYTCLISDPGSITNRFVLHFTQTAFGEEELQANEDSIHIWTSNQTINLYNPGHQKGSIRIFNLHGQQIRQMKLDGSEQQQIELQVPAAYYLVNVISNKKVVCKKVFAY
ncbi:MAG: hypothetical protein K9G58_15230 [Bacteroidales bacterium]|nr:hypothetical protein [Bacteroidales bacterium]MCF8399523.1 hypothetical protein [Bacteroidales bacterium]